jgi:hypothetical protein
LSRQQRPPLSGQGKPREQHGGPHFHPRSNIVDVEILLLVLRVRVVAVLVELEADALVALVAVRVRLVDLCVFGELAVGLEGARFVGRVLEAVRALVTCGSMGKGRGGLHDVALFVLVVAQTEQYYVALVDPDLLAQLAADMAQAAGAVEALRF